MKRKLSLDKELIAAGSDSVTLDGGTWFSVWACSNGCTGEFTCLTCPDEQDGGGGGGGGGGGTGSGCSACCPSFNGC